MCGKVDSQSGYSRFSDEKLLSPGIGVSWMVFTYDGRSYLLMERETFNSGFLTRIKPKRVVPALKHDSLLATLLLMLMLADNRQLSYKQVLFRMWGVHLIFSRDREPELGEEYA
ncbi:hypothetical protein KQX54_014861 [Cotesia glomerata]|uniref:Uncharacterized protein n=1 Tax=Cotesia glomerata TaxID=32391 RepID=A0AAV7IT03_COTGL|nr:hypothetical protein KQX54_014861 [Cotesia glomerata]